MSAPARGASRRPRHRHRDATETSGFRPTFWRASSRLKSAWPVAIGLLFLVQVAYSDLDVARPASGADFKSLRPNRMEESPGEIGHRPHPIRKRAEPEDFAPEEDQSAGPARGDDMEAAETSAAASNKQPAAAKLHIARLFAPDSIQNGTQDVTIDCMFKYDKKLDQRLAIKWFFNDEVEPIYQWIPELNKRVYSDHFERFIDKQYQVNEDVDFMLQAYKQLAGNADQDRDWDRTAGTGPATSGESELALDSNLIAGQRARDEVDELATAASDAASDQAAARRKLLANRLSRLAKLGSDHSRQLLGSLRAALAMDEDEVSKFRALRLVRPTLEMDGRYTCSISSLDGDDLKSTRLIVYEPPKSFTFNVSRSANQMYNLTCHAGPTFPRPSLALYRYRAGQVESQQQPSSGAQDFRSGRHAHRPRLAATALKQEPLANTQVQLKISARQATQSLMRPPTASNHKLPSPRSAASNDIAPLEEAPDINLDLDEESGGRGGQLGEQATLTPYEISAWALVDEASLSSNLVTQFECVLTIDGANYEQRQSLALQKGWHVNSSALTAKSTLVGLMSVLASLSCLAVALVSAVLIFKLLRRHANKSTRIHQQVSSGKRGDGGGGGKRRLEPAEQGKANPGCEVASSSASTTPSDDSATTSAGSGPNATDANPPASLRGSGLVVIQESNSLSGHQKIGSHAQAGLDSGAARNGVRQLSADELNRSQQIASSHQVQQPSIYQQKLNYQLQAEQEARDHSDGIYRVPESRSSFGTRYMIAGGQQQMWSAAYGLRGSPGLACPYTHQNYEPDDIHNQLVSHHYQQNGQPRGMLNTNQMAGINGSDAVGQKQQAHRSQPATISVNGKQLYC